MIKINLANKKSAATVVATSDGRTSTKLGKISMDELREIPNLMPVILLAVCWYAVTYFLDDYKETEIRKLDVRIEELQGEQTQLRTRLAESKVLEQEQKQYEVDEKVIKTKIEVIQKLLQDRMLPPKMLLTLSHIIPVEVWLSDIQLDSTSLKIKGDALDFNPISEFMKNIKETAYFKDANLRSSQQGKEETGLEVTKFEIHAERRDR